MKKEIILVNLFVWRVCELSFPFWLYGNKQMSNFTIKVKNKNETNKVISFRYLFPMSFVIIF